MSQLLFLNHSARHIQYTTTSQRHVPAEHSDKWHNSVQH